MPDIHDDEPIRLSSWTVKSTWFATNYFVAVIIDNVVFQVVLEAKFHFFQKPIADSMNVVACICCIIFGSTL